MALRKPNNCVLRRIPGILHTAGTLRLDGAGGAPGFKRGLYLLGGHPGWHITKPATTNRRERRRHGLWRLHNRSARVMAEF